jgi:hypothetical protein
MLKTISLRRARSSAIALLSVLAIAVQCLLVQTHVDAFRLGAAPAPSIELAASAGDDAAASNGIQRHCVLCEAMALTGAFVLAAAPASALTPDAISSTPLFASVEAASAPRSHNWRSRAPPRSS